jgi:hypothetical protein
VPSDLFDFYWQIAIRRSDISQNVLRFAQIRPAAGTARNCLRPGEKAEPPVMFDWDFE